MNILISDTADLVAKRKRDGRVFVTAETQLASISQTLGINEKVFGSIGNKALAVMKGQKEVTTTVRNALYNMEFLSLTQGVSIQEDYEAKVYKREDDLTVADNTGILEVTIQGVPSGSTVYVRNAKGETESATISSKVVTVPTGHAVAGEKVSVTYPTDVTGRALPLESDKFGEAFELEYHTIGIDPATNNVVLDIYIQLDHTVPSGEMELSLENGTPVAPEITFDALTASNSTQIGRIIEVERV